MNLQPVTNPTKGYTVPCFHCGKPALLTEALADLDGPAFKAYYHPDCAPKA